MSSEDKDLEIWVNEFTEQSAQKFRNQVLRFSERGGPDILIPVYIDSYGGYVDSLAKMIETMDSIPNRFATIASGKAMSCGAILLSHGDYRWCGKYSRVMIHNIHGGAWGDAYDKEQASQETMRMQKQFMGLLAKNCGITMKQLESEIKQSISSKEVWLDASQAISFGIVDYVGSPTFVPVVKMAVQEPPVKKRMSDEDKGLEKNIRKRRTHGSKRK